MYQHLDDLEFQYIRKKRSAFSFKKIMKEVKILGVIFAIIFLGMYVVTNAQLVKDTFQDRFNPQQVNSLTEDLHKGAQILLETNQKKLEVESLIDQYSEVLSNEKTLAPTIEESLVEKLDSYEFEFNLLPPTNRLVIPTINLDVPIVRSETKEYADFSAGMFDTELENWVVKYPTTPDPGQEGNTFLFGHTSQEYWKNNKYGTVFRNIPKLKEGDSIQVVRWGNLYQYRVVKTVIVKPKEVNDTYMQYANKSKQYLTLMGCYPIGRMDKRMMIFAEKI